MVQNSVCFRNASHNHVKTGVKNSQKWYISSLQIHLFFSKKCITRWVFSYFFVQAFVGAHRRPPNTLNWPSKNFSEIVKISFYYLGKKLSDTRVNSQFLQLWQRTFAVMIRHGKRRWEHFRRRETRFCM